MISWAVKRRTLYAGAAIFALVILIGVPLFLFLNERPTCFDGEQNGNELGVDCGGSCQLLCEFQVVEPIALWSRAFKVSEGIYSVVAYVENPNVGAFTQAASYTFELFDSKNISITKVEGNTFILPGSVTPVFESGVFTGSRVPVQTFFELTSFPDWYRADDEDNPLSVTGERLIGENTLPRINAVLENSSVSNISDIEVVAVVFNALGNAIAVSRTLVEFLPKKDSTDIVFTWSEPFTKELEACTIPVDTVLLLDVSGSMNDDSSDPPQPLTDAKQAAVDFVGRLSEFDQSGLISFATRAATDQKLTFVHGNTISAITSLKILPEEESGNTNIGDAIERAIDELVPVSRLENDKFRQVLVLLTDGRANAPLEPGGEEFAEERATFAKNRGYTIYTIGLGDKVNIKFLKTIASDPQQFYQAATSKDLARIYKQISDAICERGPAVIELIPRSYETLFIR